MARRRRQALAAAAIVLLAGLTLVAGITLSGGAPQATGAGGGEVPTALGQHLASLRQSVPGNQGMAMEGPSSAAEDAFAARAYPDTTIAVSDVQAARSAWASQRIRPKRGNQRPGTWFPVGPSKALYPFTELRNAFNYVPNEYVAGGRTTDIEIDDRCGRRGCTIYITPAGGGLWKTRDALARNVKWEYLGGPLGINAAGSVTIDNANDPTGETIYVGTGEANICGSGCVAGVGMYRSTDGGENLTLLGGPDNALKGKGIGEILIEPGAPNVIYAATTTALRGMSEVCCTGVTRPVPGSGNWGLYKSTDSGATWRFIHNGGVNEAACAGDTTEFLNGDAECSPRGVRHIAFDPNDATHQTLYASSYARGIWRSTDGGESWAQIKLPLINTTTNRAAIAVAKLHGGATRLYVYEGFGGGNPYSRLFRSDNANAAAPVFQDLTSPSTADPGFAWHNICEPQCWYDMFVHTPKGHPDIVYAGGDYSYGETIANKRAVILSTDAGVSGTDMTFDGTDELHPNGIHPDQHAIATNPSNPFQFFEAGDGGVVRSSGEFVDRSAWCDDPNRGLSGANKARCQQMLSRIPSRLDGINDGLSTLQWIKLKASPHDPELVQGGTQDNGTWEAPRNGPTWENTMIGDGGWNGFDVALPDFRFHTFFDASPDVNFDGGDIAKWIWIADPIFGHPGTQFYAPVISDPVTTKWMFAGTGRGVYRTKTHGLGTMSYEEAQRRCNEWTGAFDLPCGDWVKIDAVALNGAGHGADKAGGAVAAVERTTADTTTAWAATTTGRVFVTKNVGAEPAGAVTWTRVDDDNPVSPNRFVSSIHVDPENGNVAWVSYSGYNANDPGRPGHVFRVAFDPVAGTSTWTDLSHDFGDLPVNDLVRDDLTGDLYAATDFGVSRLADGTATWTESAPGLPAVEVTSLEVIADERILYGATHGLSAWRLNLAKVK